MFTPSKPLQENDLIFINEAFDHFEKLYKNDTNLDIFQITANEFLYKKSLTKDLENLRKSFDYVSKQYKLNDQINYFVANIEKQNIDSNSLAKITTGANGCIAFISNRPQIYLNYAICNSPILLVSTIAHELAHYKMYINNDENWNDEYYTDLLTVYLGFGLFSACQSVVHTSKVSELDIRISTWEVKKNGYLSQEHYGYALALYLVKNDQPYKIYKKYLPPDVYITLKKSVKYLMYLNSRT